MILPFSIVLILASFYSFTSAGQDDFSPRDLKNINQSIFIEGSKKEIKIGQYLTSYEMTDLMQRLEKKYPHIVRINYIGHTSLWGSTIHAVHISRNVRKPRPQLKPMFKFVANIHGNDAVGYALMVSLIQYLVYNDGVDARITTMLDNIDIWIVPTLNPEGLEKSKEGNCSPPDHMGKYNGQGRDLDQDFLFKTPRTHDKDNWIYEKETSIMIQFIQENPFVLSGNLQGGALVASYPWDYDSSPVDGAASSLTQDNEVFVKLAKDYAEMNTMMRPGTACNEYFPGGITIGNNWRKRRGSMQDANYILSNCFEITLYLGCCKHPAACYLPLYWRANLESMLNFIESTRRGVYGLVTNMGGDPVKNVFISVEEKSKKIKATEEGEYWRLLVPGRYHITASARGYFEKTLTVDITEDEPYVHLDFLLHWDDVSLDGTVRDFEFQPINKAVITVRGKTLYKKFKVRDLGGYFLHVTEGQNYTVTAEAPGYFNETKSVYIPKDKRYNSLPFILRRPQVQGTVKDDKDNYLKTAVITVLNWNQTFKCEVNRKGYYTLEVDIGENYTVTASASGYISETRKVDLTEKGPVYINFVLQTRRRYVVKKMFSHLPCCKP